MIATPHQNHKVERLLVHAILGTLYAHCTSMNIDKIPFVNNAVDLKIASALKFIDCDARHEFAHDQQVHAMKRANSIL